MTNTSPLPWPPLPATGFIAGRAASLKDMESGNAVFVAQVGGVVIGEPIKIEVPQYAWHIDVDTKRRTQVIVIQAERAQGTDMIGYLDIATGAFGAATLPEFELLGRAVVRK